MMFRTANGRLTAAEALGHREFVLTRLYESAWRPCAVHGDTTLPYALPRHSRCDPRARASASRPHVHRTPVHDVCMRSTSWSARTLFLKCENFQKVGAFKARGACNAVFSLPTTRRRAGVVTHSSGNHGAALAYAARRRGIPAHVVMPDNAPKVKQSRTSSASGRRCTSVPPNVRRARPRAPRSSARPARRSCIRTTTRAVIAGQGTAALELLEAAPGLDAVSRPSAGVA